VFGRKLGKAYLTWVFSEAASLMLRSFEPAKRWMQRQSRKRGAKKSHAILEAKISDRLLPVAEAGALRRQEVPGVVTVGKTETRRPTGGES
jgi:hypothetical protein